jgi:TrmH family RNA methyltransferase
LATKRSLRWSEGTCVLEGPDLLECALDAHAELEGVFVDGDSLDEKSHDLVARAADAGVRCFELSPGVIERVADAQHPQGVLAAWRFHTGHLDDLGDSGVVIVLDEVRDPGNLGTIIRTADAAGAAGVVVTGESVDPYNPKVLRATAGSIFHVPVVVAASLPDVLSEFKAQGRRSYAAVVRGGTPLRQCALGSSAVVVFGNESAGLSDEAVALCDETLSIEMDGRSESLNLGVAAGVVAFEALTQRRRAAVDGDLR